jgi:hypothetical protein
MSERHEEGEPSPAELQHRDELSQFFRVLAARLANDQGEAPRIPPPKPRGKKSRSKRSLAPRYLVWLLIAAALAGSTRLGTGLRRSDPLPTDLLGIWRTSSAGYEGRSFEIRPGSFTLIAGAGGSDSTTYTISRVEAAPVPNGTTFVLYYQTDRSPSDIRFSYLPGPPSSLHFNHQPGIDWAHASK